jgi:hypothetical protein
VVYAPAGELVEQVRAAGLEYIAAPEPGQGTSRDWMAGLGRVLAERPIDLVHAYEWGPCLGASFTAGIRRYTPVLMSVLSMGVPDFLPRHQPLLVGTPALAEEQRAGGRRVFLLEPPVDLDRYRVRDVAAARRRWEIGPGELVLSYVSMLTPNLQKLQGVQVAVAMADQLAGRYPLRLLIAGDGEGFEQVSLRAKRVNERHGRTVVQTVGFQPDPRPVYEAADVVLGMGGSALRGLAFGKPLIVPGEAGFWRTLTADSAPDFLQHGWFGAGGKGAWDLKQALVPLLEDAGLRSRLGGYGRRLVEDRYGLDRAGAELAGIYTDVAGHHPPLSQSAAALARSAVDVARFRAVMRGGNVVRQEQYSHSGVEL